MSASGATHDDHLLRFEPNIIQEILICGDGVDKRRRERVGGWVGIGSAQTVFQSKNAPDVFRDFEEGGDGGDVKTGWVGGIDSVPPSVKVENYLLIR